MLGYLLSFVAGGFLWAFEVIWFSRWWGGLGLVIGIVAAPVSAVFPFIYLGLEGFSALYFTVWGLALLGVAIVMWARWGELG